VRENYNILILKKNIPKEKKGTLHINYNFVGITLIEKQKGMKINSKIQ